MSAHKIVYTISEGEHPNQDRWRAIGAAFVNSDGSMNVLLDALPINGKLHIRDPKPRADEQKDGAGEAGDGV